MLLASPPQRSLLPTCPAPPAPSATRHLSCARRMPHVQVRPPRLAGMLAGYCGPAAAARRRQFAAHHRSLAPQHSSPPAPATAGKLDFKCDNSNARSTCECISAGFADCFPGAARVLTPGGGSATLSDLSLGDSVLAVSPSGRLVYTPVVMFSSRRPSQLAQFMRIHTDASRSITCGCRQPGCQPASQPASHAPVPCRPVASPAHLHPNLLPPAAGSNGLLHTCSLWLHQSPLRLQ